MLKNTTYAGALAVALASPALAQDASTVVATIDGTEITLGEMAIARAQLPQQYQTLPDDVLFQGVLDQLIQQQLFANRVEDIPARVDLALKNERRSLLAGEAINAINEEAVTQDALQEAYEARFADAEETPEWNASHLLVETEEEAAAARARVEAGEEFADVARDVSTGPSGPNGGQLGWFGPGRMVPEFETAVADMEVGGLSAPIETQFGWHIVTLNDRRSMAAPALEEVEAELGAEIREAALTTMLEDLRADADIILPEEGAFDPAVIGDLSILEPAAE